MVEEFIESLSDHALRALPYVFDFWALDHQLPPEGAWRTWVILGGRGAGKTRAGSEWIRAAVEGPMPKDPGRCKRIALVGETFDQVRDVMIFGESGIMAISPPDRRPQWIATRRVLKWENGAEAQAFSAREPEALRGPQFDGAWVDELAKWKKAQDAWDMLQFSLRLGDNPQAVVTTTPRHVSVLHDLLDRPSTVSTHAPTEANRAFLAPGFIEEVRARYAGTRLEKQELDGVLFADLEGGLWPAASLEKSRLRDVPDLTRVVVAVDPPVTSHKGSDLCGIVAAGVGTCPETQRQVVHVLEDASIKAASPLAWAEEAVAAVRRHKADRLVAEVNQGGDLVENMVRQVDENVPYRAVRASVGKTARAEPVAALYEQGRVSHAPGLDALEMQMGEMTLRGFEGKGSPDRVDALVWAAHELVLDQKVNGGRPRVRTLS